MVYTNNSKGEKNPGFGNKTTWSVNATNQVKDP